MSNQRDGYDLRAHVAAVLNDTSLTDPGEIADKVLGDIPPQHLRAALAVTLRSYVRVMMAQSRGAHLPGGHSRLDAQDTHAAGCSTQESPSGQPPADAHTLPAAGDSWKVRGVREGWARRLNGRYHTGQHEWKQLRDMTLVDLLFAAEERRATAERNQAWARRLDSWARAVTEHGVTTFGDLPAAVQAELLGDQS